LSTHRFLASVALLSVTLVLVGACRQQAAEPAPPPASAFTVTASVLEVMQSIVDPSADVVWNAVGTVVTDKGVEDTAPKTDEQWADVRNGALRLAEATNLLLMTGRHAAPPGAKSAAPGVELEGPEIDKLIDADRAAWSMRVKALLDASQMALQRIDAKDAPGLFNVGEQIEMACEGCHAHYWYPNQPLPGRPSPASSGKN
jgi:hypothetical protein